MRSALSTTSLGVALEMKPMAPASRQDSTVARSALAENTTTYIRQRGPESGEPGNPGAVGQAEVEDREIELLGGGQRHRFRDPARRADHAVRADRREHQLHRVEHERVVVGQENMQTTCHAQKHTRCRPRNL